MVFTRIEIERGSGKPLYRQLREALEHEIAMGAVDPSERLPSSRELAHELGLSRNTVNAAYQELESEGFIDAVPRSGLFLNREMVSELRRGSVAGNESRAVSWSDHLNALPDAAMPEIEKVVDWHTHPYPFVAGQVDASLFPKLAWSRALRAALEPPHLHYSLRDGVDEDDPALVEQLCLRVLPARGIEATPEQVLITQGTQQGLDLLAHALVRPGDAVGVEDPGYPDARHIFSRAGARLVRMPMDSSGVVPPEHLDGMRLLHLTPSHHSPTNVTLSIGRRHQLLALAHQHDSLIIEDDYDSEFRYQGSATPALKALRGSERIVYLGTFSKFLAPGLRLGYLVGEPELIAELRRHRRYRVRHGVGQVQRAMALLIESGQYARTVRRRRTHLARRWTALREALREHVDPTIDPPPGGVSIWIRGTPDLDCRVVASEALDHGVVVERGDVFFLDSAAHREYLRLGFAAIDLESIEPGVRALSTVLRRHNWTQ
ncbi:PLP-dependent aminotransferase family protein [Aeromicrobium sp. CF4.19]|uniref:MocR-like pyridoxine biosynthesis transcription factor PdxR n=1 Tax=Aeromicrobium sp. CF4.19 TaxID=3373082 RepID=UPI003EE524A3